MPPSTLSHPIGELEFTAVRVCSWISRLSKYFTGGQHIWQRLEVTLKPNTKAGSESGAFSVKSNTWIFIPACEGIIEPTYFPSQVRVIVEDKWKILNLVSELKVPFPHSESSDKRISWGIKQ